MNEWFERGQPALVHYALAFCGLQMLFSALLTWNTRQLAFPTGSLQQLLLPGSA